MVTWFAGIFYMVRLFIYSTEANAKAEPDRSILSEQFLKMQSRLWYIIAWPSAILTLVFGTWLMIESGVYLQPWFHLKILFVVGLILYHLICGRMHRQMKRGIFKNSAAKLRIWNEVATLFLFAIVFIVVLKSTLSWLWGLLGLVLIGVLLMLGIKLYKKVKNE